jgi:hypothetical protein
MSQPKTSNPLNSHSRTNVGIASSSNNNYPNQNSEHDVKEEDIDLYSPALNKETREARVIKAFKNLKVNSDVDLERLYGYTFSSFFSSNNSLGINPNLVDPESKPKI